MPRAAARPAAARKPKRRAAPRAASYASVPRVPARAPMVRASRRSAGPSTGPIQSAGSALGGIAGGYLGGPVGSALGSALGGVGGRFLGKIFGTGDYITSADKVKYNVLVNEAQVPQFGSNKNIVHVRHREYLGDVITSSSANTFQVQTYNINPGLSATFPWLSQVCGSSFQQYRINGMIFEYRSMSADALNSTNTALGSVVMATDYDSADAAFTSKAQMENTEFGVSCKPSSCMVHAIECARNQTAVSEQYIRAFSVPSGADIRLYDLGKFYIATAGFQGTSVNVGELWVSYDITLFKAIQQPPGYLIPSAHYVLDPSTLSTKLLTPLSTSTHSFDYIGLSIDSTGLILSWPLSIPLNSVWRIEWVAVGTGTASVSDCTIVSLNAMTAVAAWNSVASGTLNTPSPQNAAGVNTTAQTVLKYLKYTGGATPAALPSCTFAAGATMLSAYTYGDLHVSMINPNVIA